MVDFKFLAVEGNNRQITLLRMCQAILNYRQYNGSQLNFPTDSTLLKCIGKINVDQEILDVVSPREDSNRYWKNGDCHNNFLYIII